MVGSSKIEMDENLKTQTERKTDDDPLGLKGLFPEYLILKILFQGEYDYKFISIVHSERLPLN